MRIKVLIVIIKSITVYTVTSIGVPHLTHPTPSLHPPTWFGTFIYFLKYHFSHILRHICVPMYTTSFSIICACAGIHIVMCDFFDAADCLIDDISASIHSLTKDRPPKTCPGPPVHTRPVQDPFRIRTPLALINKV